MVEARIIILQGVKPLLGLQITGGSLLATGVVAGGSNDILHWQAGW